MLYHWFGRDHTIKNSEGESVPFRYYFCQREAIETFLGPLDESAKGLISDLLPLMPGAPTEQKDFFEPYYGSLKKGDVEWLKKYANNLKRTLIFKNGLWLSGLLLFCLEYNRTSKYNVGGVFEAIKQSFSKFNETDLYDTVKAMTDFRNTYVAHH